MASMDHGRDFAGDCCVAAPLTAPGRGAIAVIGLRGTGADEILRGLFRSPRGLPTSADQLRLGRIVDANGLIDEVIIRRIDERGTAWEVQCHGGPAVVDAILQALRDYGVQGVAAETFDKMTAQAAGESPIRHEARLALTQATTMWTAGVLLDQLNGALEVELETLVDECRALTRATDPDQQHTVTAQRVQRLLDTYAWGQHLAEPWRVVIIGSPNVGKSSLINALAGYERAIVTEIPGTTRDVLTTTVSLQGLPVELTDTAGQREVNDVVERAGVWLARQAAGAADLLIVLLDQSKPALPEDDALLRETADRPCLIVANKADLPPQWSPPAELAVSARTGLGIDRLMEQLAVRLLPVRPEPGTAVLFTKRQQQHLRASLDALAHGRATEALVVLQACARDWHQ